MGTGTTASHGGVTSCPPLLQLLLVDVHRVHPVGGRDEATRVRSESSIAKFVVQKVPPVFRALTQRSRNNNQRLNCSTGPCKVHASQIPHTHTHAHECDVKPAPSSRSCVSLVCDVQSQQAYSKFQCWFCAVRCCTPAALGPDVLGQAGRPAAHVQPKLGLWSFRATAASQ